MTPAQYRILKILANQAIYLGQILKLSPEQAANRLQHGNLLEYLIQHIQRDWDNLLQILNLNDKSLCGVLHLIILNILSYFIIYLLPNFIFEFL